MKNETRKLRPGEVRKLGTAAVWAQPEAEAIFEAVNACAPYHGKLKRGSKQATEIVRHHLFRMSNDRVWLARKLLGQMGQKK